MGQESRDFIVTVNNRRIRVLKATDKPLTDTDILCILKLGYDNPDIGAVFNKRMKAQIDELPE